MTATSTTTAITWNFPAATSAGSLKMTVKGNGANVGSYSINAGDTHVLVNGLQPNWVYLGTLTIGSVTQSPVEAQTLAHAGDAAAGDGTPATPTTPPIPPLQPITVRTLVTNTSLDNGKTWTSTSAIQP